MDVWLGDVRVCQIHVISPHKPLVLHQLQSEMDINFHVLLPVLMAYVISVVSFLS
jgi:hypothetical protein